jgi:hypothetical protein
MIDKTKPDQSLTNGESVTKRKYGLNDPKIPNNMTPNVDRVPLPVQTTAQPNLQPNNDEQVGKIAPGGIKRGTSGPPKVMQKGSYLSVMIEESDKASLQRLAKRRGVSVADICRKCIKDYLIEMRRKTASSGVPLE